MPLDVDHEWQVEQRTARSPFYQSRLPFRTCLGISSFLEQARGFPTPARNAALGPIPRELKESLPGFFIAVDKDVRSELTHKPLINKAVNFEDFSERALFNHAKQPALQTVA